VEVGAYLLYPLVFLYRQTDPRLELFGIGWSVLECYWMVRMVRKWWKERKNRIWQT